MRVQGALAWIWMGSEEAMLRLPEPPATLWLEAGADWAYATGHYDLVGNWILMAENLMDLTHIPFLHQASFNFPKAFAQAPVKLEISGDRLSYYRDNPPNYQRSGFLPTEASEAIEAAGFQARSTVRFVSPALTHGGGRFVLDRPGPEAQPTYEWQVIHFTTPITDRETKYWYFFARNYSLDDRALTEKLKTMIVNGFEEDRVAIELVQVMHEKDTHDYREVHFKSDAPSVAMRRIVAGMARREAEARRSPANASSIDQIEQIAAE
ncbi:hypothetical protein [uncultured Sphingomonas sp.]|uniref:hypothetical protein n=1 Tax=uncultured Sphingomonas sp. TaxID=158754 RepID=UPI0035CA39F4